MLALLDLIDNSLDAAIIVADTTTTAGGVVDCDTAESRKEAKDFVGRVHIYPDVVNNGAVPQRAGSAPEAASSDAIVGNGAVIDLSLDDDDTLPVPSVMSNIFKSFVDSHRVQDSIPSRASSAISDNNDDTRSKTTGLCIVNNALRPIRPLVQALEVYNSSKIDSGAGDIGENGVGLKQGCATLSDLSFVLVKNGPDKFVELGIVAESLQMAEGC